MSTPEVIRDNASYHFHILSAIAELDYIPSAVSQQVAYVKDLEAQLQRSVVKLEKLAATTKKEREEHVHIRDSTVLRLAHSLVGRKAKYQEKESKEEREFLDALEQELMEKDGQEMFRQMLNEAKEVEARLLAKAAQYESLKGELQNLYGRIFNGPTPEFPADDKLEYELESARALHERVQKELNTECQATQLLTKAGEIMDDCLAKMNQALGFNTWDLWGGGGQSEYMEMNALSGAQSLARQAELLFWQAQRLSPQVTPVGEFVVPFEGFFLSNVVFDNVYTDLTFRNKITEMTSNIQHVQKRLKAERDASRRRADIAGNQLIEVAKDLEESRNALDAFRRETFRALSSDQNLRADSNLATTFPAASGPFSPPDHPPSSASQTPIFGATPPPHWGSRNPYAASLSMGPQT